MYNDNPTLLNLTKEIDESKQGSAIEGVNPLKANGKHFYIESYGCQMNFSDSEIVASILAEEGFGATRNMEAADLK